MLAKRIIPCLDVKDGRVVKGVNFVALVDKGAPEEHARRYDLEGADEIALLDITATSDGRKAMLDVVRATAEVTFTPLMVGGGVASEADVEALLEAGADRVSMNSAAVADPGLVARCARRWGSQAIIVAVDVKRRSGDPRPIWDVYTRGGRTRSSLSAIDWIHRVVDLGAGEILLTSMDRDGTLSGYDLDLLDGVCGTSCPVPVIASGGAGTLEHLKAAAEHGASAILAASIFHDGTFSIGQAKAFLGAAGIPVREVAE
jgi:cyclase